MIQMLFPAVNADNDIPPPAGCICSHCGGHAWWTEATEPRYGFRCRTCHATDRPESHITTIDTMLVMA